VAGVVATLLVGAGLLDPTFAALIIGCKAAGGALQKLKGPGSE